MREGSNTSGSQAQARGLGAGAIASLTGVGLLLIFMLQNTESVRLDFPVWGFTWPVLLLTLASALLGGLVWFGVGVMRRHRRRKERREDRRGTPFDCQRRGISRRPGLADTLVLT